jgi:hypothetical protein
MICRTLAEVLAAADAASAALPPMSQAKADETWAILAPYLPALTGTQAA